MASRPSSSKKPTPLNAFSKIVYRVAGIPSDGTVDQLKVRLLDQTYCSSDERSAIEVHAALSPDCRTPGFQIAFVRFSSVPDYLARAKEGQILAGGWSLNIDSDFHGLTQLYPTTPGAKIRADIIAVTGLDGHAYGSWRSRGNLREMWLRDFFPEQLPDVRTMIYGYNSKLQNDNGFHQLEDFVAELLEEIAMVRRSYPERRRPVVFIGHSLGGVVVTQALLASRLFNDPRCGIRFLLPRTCATVFFGTPHRGFKVDNILSMVSADSSRIPLLESIQENSHLLVQSCSAFINEVKKREFPVISFYEQQRSQQLKLGPDGRPARSGEYYIALEKNAACLSPTNSHLETKLPVDRNHSDMVKFDSRHDRQYRSLVSRLQDIIKEADEIHDCVTVRCAIDHDNATAAAQIWAEGLEDFHQRDSDGRNWLHRAALQSAIAVVDLLLKYGVAIDETEDCGYTALHTACIMGNLEIVQLLLDGKANIETKDASGDTALHCAAHSGDIRLVMALLDARANIEARNKCLETPLHQAARKGSTRALKVLIERGADKEARNKDNSTALHVAASANKPAIVQLLVDAGANVQARDKYGVTPLHTAALGLYTTVARILLEGGAPVQTENYRGFTPLQYSTRNTNHHEMTDLLVQHGASGVWDDTT